MTMRDVSGGALSEQCARFLEDIAQEHRARAPKERIERVEALIARHEVWRGSDCLNMNPAEGLVSKRVRAALANDMAARLTEGEPGNKTFPHFKLNEIIDEIEGMIIAEARTLFNARYVEWRPVSTSMANAAVFHALLRRGDQVFVQSMEAGGNFAYQSAGPLGLTGAEIVEIPAVGETFEVDLEWVRREARLRRPKMIVIGGSKVLFPYRVAELRAIADEVDAYLVYDAAHLGLLIAGGVLANPLTDGAHVVTISTHKAMGGPVGGMVFTNDELVAKRVLSLTFPALMQTRDQNKYAALAIALAETAGFASQLAGQMVVNAQALARELERLGFEVLGSESGYTRTHQLFLKLGQHAARFERRCQEANIIIPDCALTGDAALKRRSGARVATHEVTRIGMGTAEMKHIAQLISDAAQEARPLTAVLDDVLALRRRFADVQYSFDARLCVAEP